MSAKRLAVLPLFLALACKSPSATEQMDSIISWLGTAGLTGEAWLRHTTPDKYTRQTLELTHDSLIDISSGLFKRSEERRVGKGVDLGCCRIIKKRKIIRLSIDPTHKKKHT